MVASLWNKRPFALPCLLLRYLTLSSCFVRLLGSGCFLCLHHHRLRLSPTSNLNIEFINETYLQNRLDSGALCNEPRPRSFWTYGPSPVSLLSWPNDYITMTFSAYVVRYMALTVFHMEEYTSYCLSIV